MKPPPSPRILIARLSAPGDLVQTLPLLSEIRRRLPDAFIGWVVEEGSAPLVTDHPLIDRLHVSRRKAWLRGVRDPRQWWRVAREVLRFFQDLRQSRYDVGLDVQGLLKSALPIFLAGIPRRIGYEATREQAARLYTETLAYHDLHNPHLPTVRKFLEFADAVAHPLEPSPPLVRFVLPPTPEASRQKVADFLQRWLAPGQPLITLAPGTIWPTKHWTEAHWAELLAALAPQPCLLIGAPGEEALTERILSRVPETGHLRNWVGETTLMDLPAVFERTTVFVGLDSAPLHIANATGHPRIVGLFGPTAPGRTGPVGEAHLTLSTALACQPCFSRRCRIQTHANQPHACMEALSPQEVLQAVRQQLQRALTVAAE